jgi:hypothetical protein
MSAGPDATGDNADRGLDRRRFLIGFGSSFAAASGLGGGALVQAGQTQPQPTTQSRPNILFMLGGNVGDGVLSSYNGGISETPTPRIDSLGTDGLRLTKASTSGSVSRRPTSFIGRGIRGCG